MIEVENFNRDIAEIKRIQKSCQPIQENPINDEDSTEYINLKKRYEAINASMKPASSILADRLAEFHHLLEILTPEDILIWNENSKITLIKKPSSTETRNTSSEKAFSEIAGTILSCLNEDMISYSVYKNIHGHPTNGNYTLFEIFRIIGSTKWAQDLIFNIKEIYFEFTNIYIFSISKYLALPHLLIKN